MRTVNAYPILRFFVFFVLRNSNSEAINMNLVVQYNSTLHLTYLPLSVRRRDTSSSLSFLACSLRATASASLPPSRFLSDSVSGQNKFQVWETSRPWLVWLCRWYCWWWW